MNYYNVATVEAVIAEVRHRNYGVDYEAAANARLIAAAPSMLYALRAIKRTCPTDPDVTREFNAAWGLLEAAIAKAEGL